MRVASVSSRSRRLPSAQWMSSNTSSVGSRAASISISTRAEKNSVSRSKTSRPPPSPISIARFAACSSASSGPTRSSTAARSFACASGSWSLSNTPATCLMCCAKALYGLLAPYGVERPRSTRAPPAATSCANSNARRDLPIPAGPNSVTRCGRRSDETRSHVPDSASSSRLRPTIGARVSGRSPASASAPTAIQTLIGPGLALRHHRLCRPVVDDGARARVRLLADDHRSDRGRALEACGGVHDVTGNHRLAEVRPGIQRHDRLAGIDGDAEVESFLVLGPVADGERRAHRSLGIVAVRDRSAEQAHHRVADELLHHAAVTLDLRPHALVVRIEERAHVLRVQALRVGREADEIDEEDGDDAPLLPGPPRLGQRRAARRAKPRAGGVVVAAARADRHGQSVDARKGRATLDW